MEFYKRIFSYFFVALQLVVVNLLNVLLSSGSEPAVLRFDRYDSQNALFLS